MKKKNINSIDINAKTLSGQPASYYSHQSRGLGTTMIQKSDIDMNELVDQGFYGVGGVSTNVPIVGIWLFVTVQKRNDFSILQQCISQHATNPRMFFRVFASNAWSPWKEVATL